MALSYPHGRGASTVTFTAQLLELPEASIAVTVIVFWPIGSIVPDGGLAIETGPGQLSLADGTVKLTVAIHKSGS